jgi:hypothetical protein
MRSKLARELWSAVLSIVLVTGGTAIGLRILKEIPSLIQENTRTLYRTTEEAESALGVKVLLPAYFPETFAWPPRQIMVMRDGNTSVVTMTFSVHKQQKPELMIQQIFGRELIGTDEHPDWARVAWKMADRTVILTSDCDRETLLKMARSMN